jgi:outer membrane receptor protein involved in Fe transport
MSPVIIEPFQAQPTLPLATPQFGGPNPAFLLDKYESIEAYDYFDLSFRYRALDKLTLTLTIDNLLDKKPPSLGEGVGAARANVGNTFPGVFDVLGRSYTFGARLTF